MHQPHLAPHRAAYKGTDTVLDDTAQYALVDSVLKLSKFSKQHMSEQRINMPLGSADCLYLCFALNFASSYCWYAFLINSFQRIH